MAKRMDRIAKKLGAKGKGQVPDTGGGTFGMNRLARILSERLQPSMGLRPGRPCDPQWVNREKVRMSDATKQKLKRMAKVASQQGRRITPMQIAAQLLEESVERYSAEMKESG